MLEAALFRFARLLGGAAGFSAACVEEGEYIARPCVPDGGTYLDVHIHGVSGEPVRLVPVPLPPRQLGQAKVGSGFAFRGTCSSDFASGLLEEPARLW